MYHSISGLSRILKDRVFFSKSDCFVFSVPAQMLYRLKTGDELWISDLLLQKNSVSSSEASRYLVMQMQFFLCF